MIRVPLQDVFSNACVLGLCRRFGDSLLPDIC